MTSSDVRQGIFRQTDAAKRALRFALGLLFVFVSLAAYAVNESDLLPVNEAFPLTVSVSGPHQVTLDFGTKPGYYLYQDRFSFSVDGVPVKPDQRPAAESKDHPTFGMVRVYHRPVQIRITDARVASECSHWKLLPIDVTKNTPEDAEMLGRFGLLGPRLPFSMTVTAVSRSTRNWSGLWVLTRSWRI
ncbi:protein-disulfide reductase DsbD family protein [Paraburkholderia strydomiana]|uniref:protein-disulfide reductase DsbD domain-containing protein n=1 Tax=Paraburkholderia strydomiana TaxID=1245417 RepID=UPI0038B8CDBE